jgi:hypothetical protein
MKEREEQWVCSFNLNKFIQHALLHGNTTCFKISYVLLILFNFLSTALSANQLMS